MEATGDIFHFGCLPADSADSVLWGSSTVQGHIRVYVSPDLATADQLAENEAFAIEQEVAVPQVPPTGVGIGSASKSYMHGVQNERMCAESDCLSQQPSEVSSSCPPSSQDVHGSEDMLSVSSQSDDSICEMLERFSEDCGDERSKYWFDLKVERVFEVKNSKLESRFGLVQGKLHGQSPNIQRLYHGTSGSNAQAIIAEGFKLPKHSGMFGKGVYLAKTPLKCWQYSTREECECSTHYVLVCNVALGSQKEMSQAGVPFRRKASVKDAICRRPKQQTTCDSVKGLSVGQGGSLRVQEHVVYNPAQVLPLWLLELREQPRSGAPE